MRPRSVSHSPRTGSTGGPASGKARTLGFLLPCILLLAACGGNASQQQVKDRYGRIRAVVDRMDGMKDGAVRFYAPDGRITTTGRYTQDSRDGAWVTTGPAGDTLSIVTFRKGIKQGWQAYWAPGGQLLRVEQFEDGKPHGPLYRFFADGSPRQVTWYKHGVPNGTYMEWYKVEPTSIALTWGQFRNGERTGKWSWYYGNGRLKRQGTYTAGKQTGLWRSWTAQGTMEHAVDHGSE